MLKFLITFTSLIVLLTLDMSYSWNNGPSGDASTDEDHPSCENIPYSTHDWIADQARALLPEEERSWLNDNKKLYLLGTEAPDNREIPDSCNAPNNGYDDRSSGHSVKGNDDFSSFFIDSNGNKQDRAAFRAKEEYLKAQSAIRQGQLSDAAFYAGAMAHYIGDTSQYGHSVDFEHHHSDYEGLISRRTDSFEEGEFETDIIADGLTEIDAYDAVVIISKSTAEGNGDIKSAEWMDINYNNRNEEYFDSVGASLNLGVNTLADVLHTLYINNEEFINNPDSIDELEPVIYTVKEGDTLGSIAREFLGDGRRWRTIWAANKNTIDNPSNLQIGMQLVIP
jgi:nucleoid-associated protein YgaU